MAQLRSSAMINNTFSFDGGSKVVELVNLIDQKLFSIRKNLLMPLYVNQISNYDHFFSILDTRPWILAELLIINSNISHKVETIEGPKAKWPSSQRSLL